MARSDSLLIVGACGLLGSSLLDQSNKLYSKVITADFKSSSLRYHFQLDLLDATSITSLISNLASLCKDSTLDIVYTPYIKPSEWPQRWPSFSPSATTNFLQGNLTSALLFSSLLFQSPLVDNLSSLMFIGSIYSHISPRPSLYDSSYPEFSPIDYVAAKHALHGVVKYLSKLYASHNVSVNMYSPGGILAENMSPEFIRRYNQASTFDNGALLSPVEVAEGILTILNMPLGFTGQSIIHDYGFSA